MMSRPGTRPEDYRYWVDERVRYNDLDTLGHVNNIAFAAYVEAGRAGFLGEIGYWVMGAERQNVIVRTEMDYLREVRFPAQLRIGVAVRHIGSKSATLAVGIFQDEHCVLVAVNVIVRFNVLSRSAVTMNDAERAMLMPYVVPLAHHPNG